MVDEGHLYLADTRDHTATVLFPTETSRPRHDTATYGACSGPPTALFRPHGLSLRPGAGKTHTLYVVGHGGREAVEVFQLDVGGASPIVTWVGCVVAPDMVSLNSVAALPDGGLVATNFQFTGGELWEWHPAAGWAKVPGSETASPNGVVVSPDGRWFYIGGWGSQSLIRLSRGQTSIQKDTVDVGFQIDNVRWGPRRLTVRCRARPKRGGDRHQCGRVRPVSRDSLLSRNGTSLHRSSNTGRRPDF